MQSFIPLLHVSLQSVPLRTGFDSSDQINRASFLLKKLITKLPDLYLCWTELFLFPPFFKAAVFWKSRALWNAFASSVSFFLWKNSQTNKSSTSFSLYIDFGLQVEQCVCSETLHMDYESYYWWSRLASWKCLKLGLGLYSLCRCFCTHSPKEYPM